MSENNFFTRTSILVVTAVSVMLLGFIDYETGWELGFFVFYFIPIAIAAWTLGRNTSHVISVLSAVVWFIADRYSGHPYSVGDYAYWNAVIRLLSFLTIGYSVARIHELLAEERCIAQELREALSQVKTLSGLIPICANCKRTRNEKGYWQQVEEYVEKHTNAQFTHGLCQECADKLLKEAGCAPLNAESDNGEKVPDHTTGGGNSSGDVKR
jgi:hypothetical protein